MTSTSKAYCRACEREIRVTKDGLLFKHQLDPYRRTGMCVNWNMPAEMCSDPKCCLSKHDERYHHWSRDGRTW